MSIKEIVAGINYNPNATDNIHLYHGTKFLGKGIPYYGFRDNEESIWNCSCENMIYFYELNAFCKSEGCEEDSDMYKRLRTIERANEQGQIQEATEEVPHDKTFVLEFILPKELEEYILEDDSCEGMGDYGAVEMNMALINEIIEQEKCTINVYGIPFFPKLAYFYIAGLMDNPYTTEYFDNLPKAEHSAIEAIRQNDTCWFFDEIMSGQEITFEKQYGVRCDDYYHDTY